MVLFAWRTSIHAQRTLEDKSSLCPQTLIPANFSILPKISQIILDFKNSENNIFYLKDKKNFSKNNWPSPEFDP